jgi:threonine/homoserine/homoserine lactone efflux protein
METATLFGFVFVSFIGIATPGPDVLLCISNGCRYGVSRAAFGIAGVAVSDLLIMSAVALGLGAALAASELFFLAVKLFGIGYLLYLGVRLLSAQASPLTDASSIAIGHRDLNFKIFRRSFLVAFTNVKVWLFFAAFLPQFINTTRPPIPQYLVLSIVFEMLNVGLLLIYAISGAGAMRVFKSGTALWLDRLSGVVLLALAVALMFYQNISNL